MKRDEFLENYRDLANAVIEATVKDYKKALKKWKEAEILSLYAFFMSDYFSELTDVDPRVILQKIEQEVDNERKGSIKRSISHRA